MRRIFDIALRGRRLGRSVRRWAIVVAILLAVDGIGAAGVEADVSPGEQLAQADQAFRNNDYDAAVQAYGKLAQIAPDDPAVLYNLGAAYVRQGDNGRAIWRLLQAMQLAPRDVAVRNSLAALDPNYLQDMVGLPIPPLNRLMLALTANEWTALAVSATTLGLLLLALNWWLEPRRRLRLAARRGGVLLLLAGLVAWAPAVTRYYLEDELWRGVVVAKSTAAHIDPNDKSYENFTLPVGKVVRILDQPQPGWLKIRFAGDSMGFVQRDRVEFL